MCETNPGLEERGEKSIAAGVSLTRARHRGAGTTTGTTSANRRAARDASVPPPPWMAPLRVTHEIAQEERCGETRRPRGPGP